MKLIFWFLKKRKVLVSCIFWRHSLQYKVFWRHPVKNSILQYWFFFSCGFEASFPEVNDKKAISDFFLFDLSCRTICRTIAIAAVDLIKLRTRTLRKDTFFLCESEPRLFIVWLASYLNFIFILYIHISWTFELNHTFLSIYTAYSCNFVTPSYSFFFLYTADVQWNE